MHGRTHPQLTPNESLARRTPGHVKLKIQSFETFHSVVCKCIQHAIVEIVSFGAVIMHSDHIVI